MPGRTLPIYITLALLLVFTQYSCTPDRTSTPKALKAVLLDQPVVVKDFELTTQYGTTFSAADLTNHWTLMFFGYTHCPDVCPTTLTELASLAQRLPDEREPQIVFVSVDPQRDSPEHLKQYVAYFNEHFLGLTGPMDKISALTEQLNIKHSREAAVDGQYTVNHSSAILLIDPQGRYVAKFNAPHYAEKIQEQIDLVRQFITLSPNA